MQQHQPQTTPHNFCSLPPYTSSSIALPLLNLNHHLLLSSLLLFNHESFFFKFKHCSLRFATIFFAAQTYTPCSVCGDGLEVGNPDAIYYFGSCGELENFGVTGFIDATGCEALPQLISAICGCQPTTAVSFINLS